MMLVHRACGFELSSHVRWCSLRTRSASWRGVGDIFSASCSTIKTSYIAIGSQKCAQHRDCSAGELCSKAGVHGEASAPPQPRRAISQVFWWPRRGAKRITWPHFALKFRSLSLPAVEPSSLRIRRIGIWDFSCVLGIYIVKVPPQTNFCSGHYE